MPIYISLLRGINVGAKNRIKMPELKQLYEELGLSSVVPYIQSGTVVFESLSVDPVALITQLQEGIATRFGFQVPVLIFDLDAWEKLISQHPFLKCPDCDPAFFHLTFLDQLPKEGIPAKIESKIQVGERLNLDNRVVYLYCPLGYGNTKLTTNLIEKQLGVLATTRNWKTVLAVLDLAKSLCK